MSEKVEAGFHEPRRTRATKNDDSQVECYMGMHGRISVASLLAHLATIAPGVKPEEMMLNWATVKWVGPSTAEERAGWEEWRIRAAERMEKWERETLARLTAKYDAAPASRDAQ